MDKIKKSNIAYVELTGSHILEETGNALLSFYKMLLYNVFFSFIHPNLEFKRRTTERLQLTTNDQAAAPGTNCNNIQAVARNRSSMYNARFVCVIYL